MGMVMGTPVLVEVVVVMRMLVGMGMFVGVRMGVGHTIVGMLISVLVFMGMAVFSTRNVIMVNIYCTISYFIQLHLPNPQTGRSPEWVRASVGLSMMCYTLGKE